VLGVYWLLNPGALTGRFGLISIWANKAPLKVVVDLFLTNYVSYFSPNFLFLQGDANPRQNTEIGGMLLWVTAPLLIAGILVCWQRRRQPLVQFLIAAILLAPIAAALTNNGTPHALRSSVMLPFLIILAVLGADGIRLTLRDRSRLGYAVTAVLGLGLLAQGAVYTFDLYRAYPFRAASDFDTGEIAAITTARAVAGGHHVYLSDTLDQPYIEACFALVPQPPSHEQATTLRDMLDCFMRERGFGIEELATLFRIGMRDIAAWYGTAIPRPGARPSPEPSGCTVVSAIARKRGAATGAHT